MSNDQVKRSGIFYVKEPAGVVVMWREYFKLSIGRIMTELARDV